MEPLSANDPQMVGEYQLRARLGAGGMGRVYLGYSRAGRAVAVKVIHPELARDAEFRLRFSREVAAARAVSGMYTAAVVAAGLDDDPPWLATAFVPGPSLSDVVNGHGPLPEAATWRLAAGLAEALSAVHACGLVHRDLKPANVLLASDGPHVIDFGISRAFDGTSVTLTGMVVGTPGYMSPEQAEGTQAGPASDVFSLGCVLAYAAAGNAPFGSGSAASVLYRVVAGQPDLTGVPGRLREVISACLAKDPARRPELSALGAMVAQAGPAIMATPTSFWPAPVAEVIRAAQAYPTQVSPVAGSPMAGSPVQPSVARSVAGQAGFAPGGFGPGQSGFAPSGFAQSGSPQGGFTSGGFAPGGFTAGQSGFAPGGPVQDGYLAAATASMAARRPAGTPPTIGMTAPAQPAQPAWAQPTPTPWPQPSAADPMAQYTPAPLRPRPPTSVLTAAWLMYSGAAFSVLNALVSLSIIGSVKNAFLLHHPGLPGNTVKSLAGLASTEVLVGGAVVTALWIWLAVVSKQGHGWTRTVGTVLFGVYTFVAFITLGARGIGATKGISALIWLIGLTTVIMLWQPSATKFFASRR